MKNILEAVNWLHAKNIVHRDLKVISFIYFILTRSWLVCPILIFTKKKNFSPWHLGLQYSYKWICHINDRLFFKPENILLDVTMNVKISDFGFAMQLEDDIKLTGKVLMG